MPIAEADFIEVELNERELQTAIFLGHHHIYVDREFGGGPRIDQNRDPRVVTIEGRVGEAAVAKWLGLFDEWAVKRLLTFGPDNALPDVGLAHVKACQPQLNLLVPEVSIDRRYPLTPFILVWPVVFATGGTDPAIRVDHKVRLAGVRCQQDIAVPHYWDETQRRPCYRVPWQELNPLEGFDEWHRRNYRPHDMRACRMRLELDQRRPEQAQVTQRS